MRGVLAILVLTCLACGAAAAEPVPLPKARPAIPAGLPTFRDVAGADFDSAAVTGKPSACDERLAAIAVAKPMPHLIGPGACGGPDMVALTAVLLPDRARVMIKPTPVLRCPMAESVAAWVRDEVAPRVAQLGPALRAVENFDSYECRGRNRIAGAKISEHAKGNAIDVRALTLADGRRIVLTDERADKPLREALRETACHRFTTVLGPGDPYHASHIHLDILERRNGYRICQWEVREPGPPPAQPVPLPMPRPEIAGTTVKHSLKL
jgi:hypothetical protein